MTKSFTYNVVLTKSRDVASKLFFNESQSGRLVNRKRLSTIFAGLTASEKSETLVVSPFTDSGFISMTNEFPGGGAPRFISIKFLETQALLENFLIPSNAQDELIRNRFKKRFKNLSNPTQDILDVVKKYRQRYYLSYGVGDDVSNWAGPFSIELSDANLSITSDGVRELDLGFMPTEETVKVFTNRQFLDEGISQGQSVFDTTRATSDNLESKGPLEFRIEDGSKLKPLNFDGDTWNSAIRRICRRYLSRKYQSIPEGNILVLFKQDLDKSANDKNAPFNRKSSKFKSFIQLYRDVLWEYAITAHFPMRRLAPKKESVDREKEALIATNNVIIAAKRARLEEINELFNRAARGEIPREDLSWSIESEKIVKEIETLEGQINVVRAETPGPETPDPVTPDTGLRRQGIFRPGKPTEVIGEIKAFNQDFVMEIESTPSDFDLFGEDPRVVMGFHGDHKTSEIDDNILESLKPFYTFFAKLKTKIDEAFDPIIFEENDLKIVTTLANNRLIEDKTSPVIIIGDRTLIRDLVYGDNDMPDLGKALSYGGFGGVTKSIPGGTLIQSPGPNQPEVSILERTPFDLRGSWEDYRKDIQSVLYGRRTRTSSFGEQIDFGPYKGFEKKLTGETLVFMHNLKNSNVLDISFDASPYKAELLNISNESIYGLINQELKGNQKLLDDTLKLRTFGYLADFVKKEGVDTKDLSEVLRVIREDSLQVQYIRGAKLDKLPAVDFLMLLEFKLAGSDVGDLVRKNRPGQTAKVAADTLRKASSYILRVDIKTLPFFNTTDFLARKCLLVGAPNKIIGSKVDSRRDKIPAPAVFSNGYYIFGYKHVITARDAYSEFTLYNPGLGDFASDGMSMTAGELLQLEEPKIVETDDRKTPEVDNLTPMNRSDIRSQREMK
jgi:hypothetical protein